MQRIRRAYQIIFREYHCYVTFILIVVNVFVFLGMFLHQPEFDTTFMYQSGAMTQNTLENPSEWYRLVKSMFLHFDLMHLGSNMLMLAMVGAVTERYIGSVSFGLIYLLGGLVGNIVSGVYYEATGANVVSAGASGAVCAAVGGLLCVVIANLGKAGNFTTKQVFVVIGIILYQGMRTSNVNNVAHGSGLVAGIIIGAVCCIVRGVRRRAKGRQNRTNNGCI